jgi:hypothetical protein
MCENLRLTLREMLSFFCVFDKRVKRKIFGLKREEVIGGWEEHRIMRIFTIGIP